MSLMGTLSLHFCLVVIFSLMLLCTRSVIFTAFALYFRPRDPPRCELMSFIVMHKADR